MNPNEHLPGKIVANIFRCSNLLERLGRGRLSEIQNPPVGQQLVDVFSPL